jgi:hypothetical protein
LNLICCEIPFFFLICCNLATLCVLPFPSIPLHYLFQIMLQWRFVKERACLFTTFSALLI